MDSGKRIHSRLVGVALDGIVPSALWLLKFSYIICKRECHSPCSPFYLAYCTYSKKINKKCFYCKDIKVLEKAHLAKWKSKTKLFQ